MDFCRFEKMLALQLLGICLIYMLNLWLFYRSTISHGTGHYIRYVLPKVLPFYFFSIYLFMHNFKNSKSLKGFSKILSWGGFTLSVMMLPTLIMSCFLGLPSNLFTGLFQWGYTPLIEWNVAFVLGFLLVWRKTKNAVTSCAFATLIISAGGLIYELPVYHVVQNYDIYFHVTYPLFIATKWFSVAFLCYLLFRERWKLNFNFFISCWFYTMFSLIYMGHPFRFFPVWMPRLVTIIMLLTLPSGFLLSVSTLSSKRKAPLPQQRRNPRKPKEAKSQFKPLKYLRL